MTDSHCESVRELLDLGETSGVAEHLADCEGCRAEARHMQQLTARLSSLAGIEPPARIDARIRSMLAPEPFGLLRRPWLAGGLAVASFVALVATVAIALSATSVAEYGPLLALGLGSAYLALSAAAVLPLMMHALQGTSGRTRTEIQV